MNIYRRLRFVFLSVTTGLALAFLLVLFNPGLLRPLTDGSNGPVSYAGAAAKASPAVVYVFASKLALEGPPQTFDDEALPRSERAFPRVRREHSLGSGVLISPEGLVLTNNHVIQGADEINIVLADGRNLPAGIIGTDADTDLAVLRVDGHELPTADIGRSEDLRVGDVVLAIGNPLGVGQAVSMGIVSATGRSQLGIATYENFIQTDAAINPGNSGGALVDTRGKLVGINTAIFSRSGGSQGIGFAIPVKLAMAVMDDILKHGRVIRGWIGVSGQDLTPALAESLGLTSSSGVLIAGVQRNGPAARAGIQPGDVITGLGDSPARNTIEIMNAIAEHRPGDKVLLHIDRLGRKLDLEVAVVERPNGNSR
jgi:Do/DeqQ family serine protease